MDCRSSQAQSGSVFTGQCNELERTEESAADRGPKIVAGDRRRAGGRGFQPQVGEPEGAKSIPLAPNNSTRVLGWSSQREGARELGGNEMDNTNKARAAKRKYDNEDEFGHSIICAEAQLSKKRSHDARIVRVSRTSGGKDRHSKVLTAKGLRDRRVRLSVSTAIQFYDLQDKLGFDQPSKAVEWLIKAAADAIDELPVLDTSEIQVHHRRHAAAAAGSGGALTDAGPKDNTLILPFGAGAAINAAESSTNDSHSSKEGQCDEVLAIKSSSSTSEQDGSKGPDSSTLSRSESRVKARKRARERTMEKFSGSTLTSNTLSSYSFPGVLPAPGNLRNHHHSDKYRPRENLIHFQYKRHEETPSSSHWGNGIAEDDAEDDHRHLLMAAAAMQPSPSSAATSSSIAAILGHLNLQRNPEVMPAGSSAHASAQQKHSVGNVPAAFATVNNNNSSNSFLLANIDQDALVQEHFAANPTISNDMNLMISMPGPSGRETLQSNSSTYMQPSPSHIQRMSSAEASQFIFTNAGDAHFQGFHHPRMMDRVREQFMFHEGSTDSLHDLKGNRSKHGQH